ncbi:MAG: hypothetical protein QME79_06230 [Bacillota bacterium]|nr:hypothetical protein [Bacillota bacterium]
MDRKVPLGQDWLVLGLASGMAASVVKSLLNCGLARAGVPTVPYHDFTAGWVLGRRATLLGRRAGKPRTPAERALGFVADTIYGGLFGSIVSYFTAQSPPGREIVKGAFGGAVAWSIVMVGLNQLRRPRRFTPAQMSTLLGMSLAWGSLHGALVGYAARTARAVRPGRRPSPPRLVRRLPLRQLREPWAEPERVIHNPPPLDEGLTPTLH